MIRRPAVAPRVSRAPFLLTLAVSAPAIFGALWAVDPLGARPGGPAAPRPAALPFLDDGDLRAVAHELPPGRLLDRSIAWLVRHQYEDGSWDPKHFWQRCHAGPGQIVCLQGGDPSHEVGVTALATLALLESGYVGPSSVHPRAAEWTDSARRGLRWLSDRMDPGGCVGPKAGKYLYGHAIATRALCRAHDVLGDDPVRKHWARRATEYLLRARQPDSGWGYGFRSDDVNTSVSAWAALAVRAARQARIAVDDLDPNVGRGLARWAAEITDADTGRAGYQRPGRGAIPEGAGGRHEPKEAATAAVLVLRGVAGEEASSPAVRAGTAVLGGDLPYWSADGSTVDFAYWLLGTEALLASEGPASPLFRSWSGRALRALAGHQATHLDACAEGSWKPVDRWGAEGGRVATTAMNALTLSLLKTGLAAAPRGE